MKTSQTGAKRQRPEERTGARTFPYTDGTGTAGKEGEDAIDLRQEAANMLRLVLAQEHAEAPLFNSSRQARVVLGQF